MGSYISPIGPPIVGLCIGPSVSRPATGVDLSILPPCPAQAHASLILLSASLTIRHTHTQHPLTPAPRPSQRFLATNAVVTGGFEPAALDFDDLGEFVPGLSLERQPVHVDPMRPGKPRMGGHNRNADSGQVITVFGASGMLGRYVVNLLGKTGHTCIIPFRGDDHEVRHLQLMGDYGRIQRHPFSPNDDDSMREAIAKSDIVINLIGKYYETTHILPWWKNHTYHDVNVRIPRRIAELCKEEGVQRLVHVSALAASETSESIWSRTKFDGETAVRSAFPDATVIRPSIMFGVEDRFLNLMAQM